MDLTSVAQMGMMMNQSQVMTSVSYAVLDKAMETEEAALEGFKDMIQAVPKGQYIDVYA